MNTPTNKYFGTLGRKLDSRNVTVSEWFYPGGYSIEPHRHDAAYISIVVQGEYRETIDGAHNEIAGPTIIVHRPGETHKDLFGPRDATILGVDMPSDWFNPLLEYQDSVFTGPEVSTSIARVMRELQPDAPAAQWFVESAVLHLVGTLVRRRKHRSPPSWLAEVTAYLNDHYAANTPLECLAALARVHPVHLARYFRSVHRCTIGDYVRSLRIQRALQDLTSTQKPIVEIAAEHGFSDQSHLTRHLRRATGRTPAAWRGSRGKYLE
jgi:AraC family transcriptional regulator